MFRDLFFKSPLLIFPMLSFAIFGAMFLGVILYVLRRGRELESRSMIALNDEAHHES